MLVPELAAKQQAKVKRKSSRKHEGVRNPTARNAIVLDRTTGMYQSNADAALATEVKYLAQRLNALELNMSKLMRDGAVSNGYAAPLPNNVVPMDVARKAKEQSKAVPVSQSGNEAEVQVLPVPEPVPVVTERPLKTADVEPKFIGKGAAPVSIRKAANDNVNKPDAVSDIVMPEDQQYVESLASQYQFSLVEVNEILYREWAKRDKWCRKHHGKPREDVRLERAIRKRGMVEAAYFKSEESRFTDWWNETEARMKHLRAVADSRRATEVRTTYAPLVKGEAKYRKRVMIRRLASERTKNPAGFSQVQSVHRKLDPGGVPVTTASQWAAITTWAFETKNKVRKLFGMQPTLRSARKRAKFEVMDALSHNAATREGDGGGTHGPDLETPTRELVRRYQRNGISH